MLADAAFPSAKTLLAIMHGEHHEQKCSLVTHPTQPESGTFRPEAYNSCTTLLVTDIADLQRMLHSLAKFFSLYTPSYMQHLGVDVCRRPREMDINAALGLKTSGWAN